MVTFILHDCPQSIVYINIPLQTKIACLDTPCQNEGTCASVDAGYQCTCKAGFNRRRLPMYVPDFIYIYIYIFIYIYIYVYICICIFVF